MKTGLPEFRARGCLYIVATPIGNLGDITLRALETMRNVDVITCEDTRHTIKILNRYQIKKPLISYFQPREKQKVPLILNYLNEGKDVALVSDAGTPGVSDPGFPLIKEAISQGIRVVPIPGPSALTASLSASGLPTHLVLFLGFIPAKSEAVKKLFHSLKEEKATLVFYVPGRKMGSLLPLLDEILGNREMVIAREITKLHEEFLRGQIEDLITEIKTRTIKGEITVLIKGAPRKSRVE